MAFSIDVNQLVEHFFGVDRKNNSEFSSDILQAVSEVIEELRIKSVNCCYKQ